MNITLKRIDKTLPLPEYQTKGSVAFDLYARISVDVSPFIPTIIPLNIVIKVPAGYVLFLASRSSTPLKKKLTIANGLGIIDQDYSGEKDELGFQVLNFSQEVVHVERGERIAQAMLVPVERAQFQEVDTMDSTSRGGFGSTG